MNWSSRVSFVMQVCVHQVHQSGKAIEPWPNTRLRRRGRQHSKQALGRAARSGRHYLALRQPRGSTGASELRRIHRIYS